MDFVCVRYWFRFDDTRFDLFGLKRRNECSKISDQISHVRSTDQKTALKGFHAKSFVLPTHKWSDQHFCLHYKMLITRRMKPAKEKERKKVRRLEWLRSPYKKWQDHSEALNIYLSELFGIFTSIKTIRTLTRLRKCEWNVRKDLKIWGLLLWVRRSYFGIITIASFHTCQFQRSANILRMNFVRQRAIYFLPFFFSLFIEWKFWLRHLFIVPLRQIFEPMK